MIEFSYFDGAAPFGAAGDNHGNPLSFVSLEKYSLTNPHLAQPDSFAFPIRFMIISIRRRFQLSIQCSIIVVFHMTTLLGKHIIAKENFENPFTAYAVLQLIHTSDALQYVAHMSWILMHG